MRAATTLSPFGVRFRVFLRKSLGADLWIRLIFIDLHAHFGMPRDERGYIYALLNPSPHHSRMRNLIFALLAFTLSACASTTSRVPMAAREDICAIFAQESGWAKDARKASDRWGVPVSTIMATMRQESNFTAGARPPRGDGFLFIPGKRPSNAYGYAQALDGTWATYQRATGRSFADRDKFDDAVDFMGWYMSETSRRNKVAATNARDQYLAYHEGWGGYAKASYTKKAWLMAVADKVGARAVKYEAQLRTCPIEKSRGFLWF